MISFIAKRFLFSILLVASVLTLSASYAYALPNCEATGSVTPKPCGTFEYLCLRSGAEVCHEKLSTGNTGNGSTHKPSNLLAQPKAKSQSR